MQYIFRICVNQLFMLSIRLLVDERLLVIKFLGNRKLYVGFWLCGASAPLIAMLFNGQWYLSIQKVQESLQSSGVWAWCIRRRIICFWSKTQHGASYKSGWSKWGHLQNRLLGIPWIWKGWEGRCAQTKGGLKDGVFLDLVPKAL